MAITKRWKIWGDEGHRQKLSFGESIHWDFSTDSKARIIDVDAEDKTGTNDYVIVTITRDSAEECELELAGQLDDGLFENAKYSKIEEITDEELKEEQRTRVKSLAKKYGSQRALAEHFGMPIRTVETWCQGRGQCPGYVLRMMEIIREYEEEKRAKAEAPKGKKLLYVLASEGEIKGDIQDEGYYWDEQKARDDARALGKDGRSYWIKGYYVGERENNARSAYFLIKYEGYDGDPDITIDVGRKHAAKEKKSEDKKLLYIVKSRKDDASDEWDEGCCWDINEARELAQARKEHDASPYEYWIEGYYVADDYPARAQAAYDRLSDDLSEEICWPDPDFYEVIKK